MREESDESVSGWISRLPHGDKDAQAKIWERYGDVVTRMARRFLGGVQRRDSDEEDVSVQVLCSLYKKFESGDFSEVTNREQLWGLLMSMTRNKAAETARHKRALKRGAGNVRGESVFQDAQNEKNGLDQQVQTRGQLDPAEYQTFQFMELIDCLGDDELRKIALLRIGGFSNAEICERTGLEERTLFRRFEKIKSILQVEFDIE